MNQRPCVIVFVAFFAAALAFVSSPQAEGAILRNLKQGSQGLDVRELQATLNRDPETKVAQGGPGSPGNETEYFGPLTHSAVMRLQQKYAPDILAPIGLTAPTGIVGSQTRLFLLRLASGESVPAAGGSGGASATAPPLRARPTILSISPALMTKSSADVVITGTNFTPTGNTVVVSSEPPDAFAGLPSSDGTTLRFTFRFTAGEELRAHLAAMNDPELALTVAQNILRQIDGPKVTRIPLVFVVRNANGQSDAAQLEVDMAALLTWSGN